MAQNYPKGVLVGGPGIGDPPSVLWTGFHASFNWLGLGGLRWRVTVLWEVLGVPEVLALLSLHGFKEFQRCFLGFPDGFRGPGGTGSSNGKTTGSRGGNPCRSVVVRFKISSLSLVEWSSPRV